MPQASVLLSYSDLTAVIYQVKHRLNAPTLIRKFDISLWYPCGAYGLAYGQVITKISRTGRLPNFLIRGAPLRARGAPLKLLLRGFLVLFLYLVWISLRLSLFRELRDNEEVKNLQFCP